MLKKAYHIECIKDSVLAYSKYLIVKKALKQVSLLAKEVKK